MEVEMLAEGKKTRSQKKRERMRRKRRNEEEEEKKNHKKQLYVFFWHCGGNGVFVHSLYALDIPEEEDSSINSSSSIPESPRERVPLQPIQLFRDGDYPRIMACVEFDSKLYFFGGHVGYCPGRITYPRTVFTMDLSTKATRARGVKRVAACEMHTGKHNPVCFVADDKIYVVSRALKSPNVQLWPFEVFEPEKNKWTKYPRPLFGDRLVGNCVVVRDKAIFSCPDGKYPTHFIYDLNDSRRNHSYYEDLKHDPEPHRGWQELDITGWPGRENFPVSIPLVDNTLYITKYQTAVFAIPTVDDESMLDVSNKMELKDVIKSRIDSPQLYCILTHIGNNRFCFLQVGPPKLDCSKWACDDSDCDPSFTDDDDYVPFDLEKCHMSITLFHAQPGENKEYSAKHLNSAHYVTASEGYHFTPLAAHLV